MTKDVWVSVFGTQQGLQSCGETDGDTGDIIKVNAPGCYYKKGDRHYILYEETDRESGQVIKTRLKFNGEQVEINRSGAINVSFDFGEKKHSASSLVTPYGTLMLETDTESLKIDESESEIGIQIGYRLGMDGEPYADCRLEIIIKAKSLDGDQFQEVKK